MRSKGKTLSRSNERSRDSNSERSRRNLNTSSPPIYPKKIIRRIVKRKIKKDSASID